MHNTFATLATLHKLRELGVQSRWMISARAIRR